MDIEKLIERLKHNYHGYSTVENNPEETFHDMVECLTALSTLQAENEKLREMYQKEKAVCHAVQAELENYRKGHCAEGGCAAEKDRDAVLAELERVKRERDAAIDCIYKIEDALDRGNDNDWAREHISEWESQKEAEHEVSE